METAMSINLSANSYGHLFKRVRETAANGRQFERLRYGGGGEQRHDRLLRQSDSRRRRCTRPRSVLRPTAGTVFLSISTPLPPKKK